ncbi:MAG: peptidoglycan DD-metalloendopeptidase family protein [Ruminococcus sp.]|nr:peptidoglycan DD-metalloendopeptidase family protein [Candidatus Copronaster equi]
MRKKTDLLKKALAFTMSVSFVFAGSGILSLNAGAESVESLKSKQAEIQAKIAEREKRISELYKDEASQADIITQLNIQLSNFSEKYDNVQEMRDEVDNDIAESENKILKLNSDITKLDKEISAKNKEIKKTVDLFCKRMRANYMSGNASVLDALIKSSNMANLLNRLELIKRVTKNDQDVVDNLNAEINAINKNKEKLTNKKTAIKDEQENLLTKEADLEEVKSQIQDTLDEIEEKSAEIERKLSELNYDENDIEVDIESYEEQEEAIKAAIIAAGGTPLPSQKYISSKGFMFPIKYEGAFLSSTFGYRDASISGMAFHGGIDITGDDIYGQPVYASKAGTVIIAEKESDEGYGKYVCLSHGGGYQTIYGHCSRVIVNEGDTVRQGQIIAFVGSTGNSTGPHLHFEVRYDGEKLNPLKFVSLK